MRPGPVDPRIYARIFEQDPDGAAILEELTVIFSRSAKLTGGIDAVLETYHRNGARAVVEFIVNRVNLANGVTTDEH